MGLGKGLLAIVVVGALLNAPLWVGNAGAGGGGAPGNGCDGGVPSGNGRAAPPPPSTIQFPFTGGADTSYSVTAPRNCVLLNASIDMEGQAALPPATERRYDISDGRNNEAWEGIAKDSPPSGGPGSYQSQQLAADAYGAVSSEDGNTHGTLTYGFGSPYQLFKFKVTEDNVTSLTVRWVGAGYDLIFDCSDMAVYIYNAGRWESAGRISYDGVDYELRTIKKTFSSAGRGYIDANGMVYIMVEGPDGYTFCMLETDYLELAVLGSYLVWPSELELDAGCDGIAEFQQQGEFRMKRTLGSDVLRAPLQALIDAADPAADKVALPFRFSSKTGGALVVSGAMFDYDRPPAFTRVPADRSRFDEDTEATALIDLDRYFKDDRDARLVYEMVSRPADDKISAQLDPDGHHLSFCSTAKDWSGTREFGLKATDSSGLFSIGFINMTVDPVNDPPVIYGVCDQVATEDITFTLTVRATDVDDPPANLSFSDDCPLFEIGPSTGSISFTPTNEQVGKYPVTVLVRDAHDASDTVAFTLTVQNVNDPPVLRCPDELKATEHELFECRLCATDVDMGDVIAYSVESDIKGLKADPVTGLISFTFGEREVGEHELELVATDLAGAEDRRSVILFVKNVNDPPVVEPGCELNATEDLEFEYDVDASDPDAGDRLDFSVDTRLFKIDPETGRIRFTPTDAEVGRHKFKVTVTDLAGLTAEGRFVLNVINVNEPPAELKVLSPKPGEVFPEGRSIAFSASALDPDVGDVPIFTWLADGKPLGSGPSFSARLPPGRHTITLVVSDGVLNTSISTELEVARAASGPRLPLSLFQFGVLAILIAVGAVAGMAMMRRRKRKGTRYAGPSPPPSGAPAPPRPNNDGNGPGAPGGAQPQAAVPGSNAMSPPAPDLSGAYSRIASPEMLPLTNSSGYQMTAGPVGAPYTPYGRGAGMEMAPQRPYPVPGPMPPQPQPPGPMVASPPYPFQMAPAPQLAAQWPPASLQQSFYPPCGMPQKPMSDLQAAMYPAGFQVPAGYPMFQHQQEPARARPDMDDLERDGRSGAHLYRSSPDGEDTEAGEVMPDLSHMEVPAGDELVTRDAMRAAINDAKEAIRAATSAGLEPVECGRLLTEAIAASYRLDYARARNLARRAEAVAQSLLERAGRQGGHG